MQESLRNMEELKNEYMLQVDLLKKSPQAINNQEINDLVKKLEREKNDLLGALNEESQKRNELEEMCAKLDKARRALKDQIQFIRDENERVLDSVKKQIRTEFSSAFHTPSKMTSAADNEDETKIQMLLEQAKNDMKEAAAISSPTQFNAGALFGEHGAA